MTMFSNSFLLVFVAVLAPSLGSQPAPSELPEELKQILANLTKAKSDFQSIFDVTDEQCPCLSPGDPDCFETDLEYINSTLCDLIANLTALIEAQPEDCPALEGCAAVVTGNYTDVLAVVDPVGTILPSLQADKVVNELVVTGENDTVYSIYYITNSQSTFAVRRLSFPNGLDVEVYAGGLDQTGRGIAFYDDDAFVSIDITPSDSSFLVSVNDSGDNIRLAKLTCAGAVREYAGRIYFGDCNRIKCVDPDGSNEEERVKFSMNIVSFDVIDDEQTVFCDGAGGLWVYNNATDCFKLVECTTDRCTDVRINRCDSRVYVAYSGNNELGIFNATFCTSVGDLEYAPQASDEPRVDFQPNCP